MSFYTPKSYPGIICFTFSIFLLPPVFGFVLSPDGEITSRLINIYLSTASALMFLAGILCFTLLKNISRKIALILSFSPIAVFIIAEAAIRMYSATPRNHKPSSTIIHPPLADYFISDTIKGGYFVKDKIKHGSVFFNSSGFRDFDEFTKENIWENGIKILVLGDSYAFGSNAIFQNYSPGFPDVMEFMLNKQLPATVWNTGIPCIGTKQQIISLKNYAPILKPDYVLLVFNNSDWKDNLLPLGFAYLFNSGQYGEWTSAYENKSDGTTHKLTEYEMWKKSRPGEYAPNNIQRLRNMNSLLKSRVLEFIKIMISDNVHHKEFLEAQKRQKLILHNKAISGDEAKMTFDLIDEVKRLSNLYDTELLVVLIPDEAEITGAQRFSKFNLITDYLNNKQIDFFDINDHIDSAVYYKGHWDKTGHLKAGKVLADKILQDWNKKHFHKKTTINH